jgi:hypothetical protein
VASLALGCYRAWKWPGHFGSVLVCRTHCSRRTPEAVCVHVHSKRPLQLFGRTWEHMRHSSTMDWLMLQSHQYPYAPESDFLRHVLVQAFQNCPWLSSVQLSIHIMDVLMPACCSTTKNVMSPFPCAARFSQYVHLIWHTSWYVTPQKDEQRRTSCGRNTLPHTLGNDQCRMCSH